MICSVKRSKLPRAEATTSEIWQSHWEMAKVFRGQDAFEEADRAFELAIEQIERSRHDLRLGTFKTDFFQDKVKVYEQYVDFLAGPLEDPTRAFGIAEQARARSFLDSLAEVRADLHRALPAEVVESEEAILDEISLLQAELRQKDAAPERRELLREKEDQLQQLYLDLRTEHPAFHAFRYPEPADLGSVQNRLSSSEVLLQYFVGEEQSHLWVVRRFRGSASPPAGQGRARGRREGGLSVVVQSRPAAAPVG